MTTTDLPTLHPLSPLSPEECTEATDILKSEKELNDQFLFVLVDLDEPAKDELAAWPSEPLPRRVSIVGLDRASSTLHEATVSLTTREVLEWRAVPGFQPSMSWDEWEAVAPALKADARWQEAMRKRGVSDFDSVQVDPWGASWEHDRSRRISWVLTYVTDHENGNSYAHPVDGLTALVDLSSMEVIEVTDHEVIPIPKTPGEYVPELMLAEPENRPRFTELRSDLKPIQVIQPEGPSFTIHGHHVEWQKWSLQVGWTMREGLVLHDITYNDRGDVRPILHRASICEMVVPYGDPSPTQWGKLAFDAGESGLGVGAISLELGCDCLGHIHYFDGLGTSADGTPIVIKNAICMHEEDTGIGWKHMDPVSGHVETRRQRRLVLSSIANVGNYEYGFFWYLYQDGNIEFEAKLNGVMQTGVLRAGETPRFGTKIAPELYAPNHQHFFCARLDVAVDGPNNTVTEMNSVPAPMGPDNPYGNGWVAEETPFRRESEAIRELNPATARFWRITNPNKLNDLGSPTAYRLLPGGNATPLHHPDSPILKRMAFASKQLWVTPVRKDEMVAGGTYPWQNPGPDGLPRWTQADRDIDNADVALWYVFGAHHVPRVEEWPVMPVDKIGFFLKPDGFFDGNPALDLPRTEDTSSCHAHGSSHANGGCH
ncbi:MAG TPA: primary-amine oxidase [Baekduia sp.]|nr:primary-amine oxidase [Baekduia sp.]